MTIPEQDFERGLLLSPSPHIRTQTTTQSIMRDVLIALLPACIAGVVFFGPGTLLTMALAIASAIGCEALFEKCAGREITVNDLSAVVTGLLLALNLPPETPWFVPVVGSAFAIIIVKQFFGGIGQNFVNPALAARCFLLISFPVIMTSYYAPFAGPDAMTSPTPLAALSNPEVPIAGNWDLFIGNVGGCIGETSALALLIGWAYLLFRKVITFVIPAVYMGTVALFTLLLGQPEMVLFNLFAGGLMIGAIFMATDYVSAPMNTAAQCIYAVGCGVITMVIRYWGGYPEGVSFSILFMNLTAPLLDKAFKRKVFGEVPSVSD
ncbi:MAG: RnfABCDGE type electron transport complex subunit D [Clostridia bacterium]|nr:RnfABCDGE type electron transport complex subunit D [Clostridia bacterium]